MSTELDYFERPEFSNSDLGLFIESPKYYKYCKDNGVTKQGKALDLGTYIHTLSLEPHLIPVKYYEQEVVKVTGMMGIFIETLAASNESNENTRQNAFRASGFKRKFETVWKNFIEDSVAQDYYIALKSCNGKEIISPRDVTKAKACLRSMKAETSISRLLFQSQDYYGIHIHTFNELEIYFEIDGVSCKAKIDRVIIDPNNKIAYEIDIKTYERSFMSNYKSFNYERQRAYYKRAIEDFCFTKFGFIPKVESYIVAVSVKEPFEADLYKIEESDLEICWERIIQPKLNDVRDCIESGIWEKRYKKRGDYLDLNYILIRNNNYRE